MVITLYRYYFAVLLLYGENLIHLSLRIMVGKMEKLFQEKKVKKLVACHEETQVFRLFLLSSLGTKCKINLCKLSSETKPGKMMNWVVCSLLLEKLDFWSIFLMSSVFLIHETNCNELLGEQWPTYLLKNLSRCSTDLRCSVGVFLVYG